MPLRNPIRSLLQESRHAPLKAIRRLMLESNGLITIAFRRGYIKDGLGKPRNDMGQQEYHINEYFKSREWTQIIPK